MTADDCVLRLLRECGPMTLDRIAECLGWSRPRAVGAVNRLRSRFLVAKHDKDRRMCFRFVAIPWPQ